MVYGFKSFLHPSQLVVFHPAAYKETQRFLAPCIAHAITPACQLFQFGFQLHNGLGMQTQLALALLVKVKRVAEELLTAHGARTRLVAVHFQEKLALDKLGYALQYALCGTLTPAEYHAIVSVTHKGVSAFGQFLVQFFKHDVA